MAATVVVKQQPLKSLLLDTVECTWEAGATKDALGIKSRTSETESLFVESDGAHC